MTELHEKKKQQNYKETTFLVFKKVCILCAFWRLKTHLKTSDSPQYN